MGSTITRWVFGFLYGFIGLLGLFMASGAEDTPFYIAGCLFFLFGVFNVFRMITRAIP